MYSPQFHSLFIREIIFDPLGFKERFFTSDKKDKVKVFVCMHEMVDLLVCCRTTVGLSLQVAAQPPSESF